MYSTLSSLGKNLILIGILILSASSFFYGWFNWKELLMIQGFAGLAFVFLSCYEFLNAQYKAFLPVRRYPYFTNSFVMFKTLKIGLFLSFAGIFFISETRIKYIYPICLTIAVTEALVMYLKYRRGICFVSIYANYLLFSQDKLTKLFASEIELVEFRHDIFYFVKKNNETFTVKLVHIEDSAHFVAATTEWLKRNKITVGSESMIKLDMVRA
jgi:hypothetical protein